MFELITLKWHFKKLYKLSVRYFELQLHIHTLWASETYFTSCKKEHNRSPLINRTVCVFWKKIVAGTTSLFSCLWRITQVPVYIAALPTRTSLNCQNINTYYRCSVVTQDKPKTQFGKWIHGVLAYYINLVHFEHKKVTDCSFKLVSERQNVTCWSHIRWLCNLPSSRKVLNSAEMLSHTRA